MYPAPSQKVTAAGTTGQMGDRIGRVAMISGDFVAVDCSANRSRRHVPVPLEEQDEEAATVVVFGDQDRQLFHLQPADEDVMAALHVWCRSLGLAEAAACLRRRTPRRAGVAPMKGRQLWLLHEASVGGEGLGAEPATDRIDRDPDIVDVVRTLARSRAGSPHGDFYTRLAELIEREIWP